MPSSLNVESTVRNDTAWEAVAKKLFDSGPVGIMEKREGTYTIFARVTGYVDDPTYGRLVQVHRVDAAPVEDDTPSERCGGIEKGVTVTCPPEIGPDLK